jgi:hypothetical protein
MDQTDEFAASLLIVRQAASDNHDFFPKQTIRFSL